MGISDRKFFINGRVVTAPPNGLETYVAGVAFTARRQLAASVLRAGDKGRLLPVPSDTYPHALRVDIHGLKPGYLPDPVARHLQPEIAAGREVGVMVRWVGQKPGDPTSNWGVRVYVYAIDGGTLPVPEEVRRECASPTARYKAQARDGQAPSESAEAAPSRLEQPDEEAGTVVHVHDAKRRTLQVPVGVVDDLDARFSGDAEVETVMAAAADGGVTPEPSEPGLSDRAHYQEFATYDTATRAWSQLQPTNLGEAEPAVSEFERTWPRAGMTRNGIAMARMSPQAPSPPASSAKGAATRKRLSRLDLKDKFVYDHKGAMYYDAERGFVGNSYCVVGIDCYREHGLQRNNKFNRELAAWVTQGVSGYRSAHHGEWGPLPAGVERAIPWFTGNYSLSVDAKRVEPGDTEPDFYDKLGYRVLTSEDGCRALVPERVVAPLIEAGYSLYAEWPASGTPIVQVWDEDGERPRLMACLLARRRIDRADRLMGLQRAGAAGAEAQTPCDAQNLPTTDAAAPDASPPAGAPAREPDSLDRICGVEEAAAILGKSPRRVRELCKSGAIRAKHLGPAWAVDRVWLERHKRKVYALDKHWTEHSG